MTVAKDFQWLTMSERQYKALKTKKKLMIGGKVCLP